LNNKIFTGCQNLCYTTVQAVHTPVLYFPVKGIRKVCGGSPSLWPSAWYPLKRLPPSLLLRKLPPDADSQMDSASAAVRYLSLGCFQAWIDGDGNGQTKRPGFTAKTRSHPGAEKFTSSLSQPTVETRPDITTTQRPPILPWTTTHVHASACLLFHLLTPVLTKERQTSIASGYTAFVLPNLSLLLYSVPAFLLADAYFQNSSAFKLPKRVPESLNICPKPKRVPRSYPKTKRRQHAVQHLATSNRCENKKRSLPPVVR